MRMTLQRRFAVCVAVLCFAVALSAQTQEWKSYSYPADGFRALFPDVPTQQKKDIATDAGNVELRAYVASVSSTTMPSSSRAPASQESRLMRGVPADAAKSISAAEFSRRVSSMFRSTAAAAR